MNVIKADLFDPQTLQRGVAGLPDVIRTVVDDPRIFARGLANAEFLRYGSIHRNTFIDAPRVLNLDQSLKSAPKIFMAGQITGVEGYVESTAIGLLAGRMAAARI